MSKISGNRPTILIVDEIIVIGSGRGYSHPQMDQIPTGRRTHFDPQLQELPGVKEEHAKAWGELLHHMFDTPEDRQLFKEATFLQRYSSSRTLKYWDEHTKLPKAFCEPQKPADHPSRKREPKGPRGKWGKL